MQSQKNLNTGTSGTHLVLESHEQKLLERKFVNNILNARINNHYYNYVLMAH